MLCTDVIDRSRSTGRLRLGRPDFYSPICAISIDLALAIRQVYECVREDKTCPYWP